MKLAAKLAFQAGFVKNTLLVPFLKIKYRFCHSRESGNPLKIRDLCKASIIKSYITFLETALAETFCASWCLSDLVVIKQRKSVSALGETSLKAG
jgi:hypothetical protein